MWSGIGKRFLGGPAAAAGLLLLALPHLGRAQTDYTDCKYSNVHPPNTDSTAFLRAANP